MKRHLKKIVTLFIILGIVSCDIVTDPCNRTGSIDGTVTDVNSIQLEGVTVTATSATETFTAETNTAGYYNFTSVPEGDYEVTFSKPGFVSLSKPAVTVVKQQNTTVDAQLEVVVTTGTITGNVKDNTGSTLSDVTITVGQLNITTVTDRAGNYTLENVPPGTYSITYSKADHDVLVKENVVVTVNQTTTLDVTLQKTVPKGSISGSVKDIDSNTGLASVAIKSVSEGHVATFTTEADGSYTHNLPVGSYKVTFSKEGYIDSVYSNVVVTEGNITYLEAVLQISNNNIGLGNASGKIIDAVTGNPVNGVTLSLRAGINNTAGSILHTATTDTQGNYTFTGIDAGHYTATISLTNYLDNTFSIVVLGGVTRDNQNCTITPILNDSETRIVLTWGEFPSDLDSHITTPSTPQEHIFYSNKIGTGLNLDLDDTTSYGPETITITQAQTGTYTYYVHDYTNRSIASSTGSTALANSGAIVKVFQGNTLKATYNVPNTGGTLWKVFTITDGNIAPINEMLYEAEPTNVDTRTIFSNKSDVELFWNLPTK